MPAQLQQLLVEFRHLPGVLVCLLGPLLLQLLKLLAETIPLLAQAVALRLEVLVHLWVQGAHSRALCRLIACNTHTSYPLVLAHRLFLCHGGKVHGVEEHAGADLGHFLELRVRHPVVEGCLEQTAHGRGKAHPSLGLLLELPVCPDQRLPALVRPAGPLGREGEAVGAGHRAGISAGAVAACDAMAAAAWRARARGAGPSGPWPEGSEEAARQGSRLKPKWLRSR
mmetsp:Transcript_79537/g.247025  ORF Transcript_79537/g.247025 Transcript_79537/m.247025 type:complete len:226 (+) Transcript_79537:1807-2484(+)